ASNPYTRLYASRFASVGSTARQSDSISGRAGITDADSADSICSRVSSISGFTDSPDLPAPDAPVLAKGSVSCARRARSLSFRTHCSISFSSGIATPAITPFPPFRRGRRRDGVSPPFHPAEASGPRLIILPEKQNHAEAILCTKVYQIGAY